MSSASADSAAPPPRLWNAIVGRGLHPYALWLCSIGIPALVAFWSLRKDETFTAWCVWIGIVLLAGWTIPLDTLGHAIVGVGKFRNELADIIPILPLVATKLPGMLLTVYPVLPQVLPHLGTVAPHIKYLLPHAESLTRIIPKLTSRIEDFLPLLEFAGPSFREFTPAHMESLEMIIDDVVDKLNVLAPHLEALGPYLGKGLLIAPKMMPHIEAVLPHLASLEKDLKWLIPFAELEGVEKMLPFLDKIAPRIHELEPFAEELLPLLPMVKEHLPDLVDNIDVLLDIVPSTADHLDPLLYWFGDLIPLANRMGILKSSKLLRAAAPMAKYLPLPPAERERPRLAAGEVEIGHEWWRYGTFDRVVTLPRTRKLRGVDYYIVHVDDRYAGEFRFKYIRELYLAVEPLLDDENVPPFPWRGIMLYSDEAVNKRRMALEKWLAYVMADINVVSTKEFEVFVKTRRRWAEALPNLMSPAMPLVKLEED